MGTDIIIGRNYNLRIPGEDDPKYVERWFNRMIN